MPTRPAIERKGEPTPRSSLPSGPGPPSTVRQVPTIALLIIGGMLWLAFGVGSGIGLVRWLVILAAMGIALLPPVTTRVLAALDRLRQPSPRTLAMATILIGAAAACYFVLTAFLQDRDLFPRTHDDSSYYLGMQMLARGRPWMPAHDLADFFESFYILTKPFYCSIYFPGTALMFVPTVWFHLPTWLMPAMVSGAAVAMLYRIVTELIDAAAGALAALLLVSLTWLRTYTVLLMSQGPMLLLGLLMIWSWLRWRQEKRWGWSLALGVFGGWAAITRPIDALAFAIPILVGIVMDILSGTTPLDCVRDLAQPPSAVFDRRSKSDRKTSAFGGIQPRAAVPQVIVTAGMLLIGALPFSALQLVFDIGVTGNAFKTPYTLYLDRNQPGSTFGFHRFDPKLKPASALPQIQADYELTKTYLRHHQPDNFLGPWLHTTESRPPHLEMIAGTTLPAGILLVLAPAGLLGLADRRRAVLFATLPVFVALYLFNPFFLEHYAIPIIPAVLLCILLGVQTVARAWPRYTGALTAALTCGIVAAAVTGTWEVNHLIVTGKRQQVTDEPLPSSYLREIHDRIQGRRAVVLFQYSPGDNWKEEPVYNSDVAWPDNAEVVRAHDLGPRDQEIVEYYARRQPDRMFFTVRRDPRSAQRQITPIATADQLSQARKQGKDLNALLHPPN